jgi:hypothetical protein
MQQWRKILSGVRKPRRAFFELYKLLDQRLLERKPVSIVEKDWDTIIILDACRNDMFQSKNTLDGDLSTVTSAGSNTVEFLNENFGHGEFSDIVYVSANPNLSLINARFHDRIRLWETEWDDNLGVTPPEPVTRAALDAAAEYPNKRLVVHYMQPHYPFIGETGLKMRDEGTIEYDFDHGDDFYRQIAESNVETDKFKQAYDENLELVLKELPNLCENLIGKTVITSDHGNEFGKLGVYGHPRGAYTKGLVRVPWLEIPYDQRKKITLGQPTEGPQSNYDIVEDRLIMLGYKNKVKSE